MRIGYFLSSEQFGPAELLDQARRSEQAGFEALWISDHFHPWTASQGESPFVWSVIGALSQAVPNLPLTTAVTCPILRIHPVILAQAAATATLMHPGGFIFGVGTGENLNEHVTGLAWPAVEERQMRLIEAVGLMRRLWSGETIDFRGEYYEAINARIYTCPESPPPVYVSAFGPQALDVVREIGEGLITMDENLARDFRASEPDRPMQTGFKVCYDSDRERAIDLAHRIWPHEVLPGQLAQELPTTPHIEQACELVTREMVAESTPCGPDASLSIDRLESMRDAGFDEAYVQQIGPDMDGFFEQWSKEIIPRFR